ncbi:MAG: hypothetical protein ACE366_10980 [Bradymonadia bacterium]
MPGSPCLWWVLCLLWPTIGHADGDHLARFNAVAQKAEATLQKSGPEAAIEIYEEALLEEELGQIHLRLGQLTQDLKRFDAAAMHYKSCMEDDRVEALDRNLVCLKGLEASTSILKIEGLPQGASVVVQQPASFAGPVESGAQVPRGPVTLLVDAPGRTPRATQLVLSERETRWRAVLGQAAEGAAPPPPPPSGSNGDINIPDGFISSDPLITGPVNPPEPSPWPIYATGGAGLALLGSGLYLGINNQDELDRVRRRQRIGACGDDNCRGDISSAEGSAQVADALWITGAAVVTAAVIWYLLDD